MLSTRHSVSVEGAARAAEISSADERVYVREALAMWGAGDFEGCIAQLDYIGLNRHTSDSIFLRARALLRIHRLEDASKWLRLTADLHTDEDAIATHAMLLGNVCARFEHFDDAAKLFDRARGVGPHRTIIAETAYYHALALWQARDYRAARSIIEPALVTDQDIVSARGRQLIGFIATAEGKFAEAYDHFGLAIAALGRCRAKDSHLQATLLHALSIIEAEVQPRDPARLDRLASDMPWTSNLIMEQVQTLRHIGLAYARSGMPELAIARFMEAGRVSVRSPWAIIGFTEAAELLRRSNEPLGAKGCLSICVDIAERLQWDNVDGEARLALLQLSAGLARAGDGERGRRFLDLYYGPNRHGARLSAQHSLNSLNFDARLANFERHSEGVIRGALENRDAYSMLADVSEAWRRVKYVYRAREARDDLRALTHRSYRYAVDQPLDRHPTVANADEDTVATITEPLKPKQFTLTAQQDRVIRRLVDGCTVAQIATDLAIEQKTVRGHLSKLFAMFEVKKQGPLVAAIMGDAQLRKYFERRRRV